MSMLVYDEALRRFRESIDKHILYNKDGLVLINKPAGVITHWSESFNVGVEEAVGQYLGRNFRACNRLDLPTTGVVLLCDKPKISTYLRENWHFATQKHYLTITHRVSAERGDEFDIKAFVKTGKKVKITDKNTDRFTKSRFRKIADFGEYSLLSVQLITGIKHQIRIHCADILGANIVGDRQYTNYLEELDFPSNAILLHSLRTFVDLTAIGKGKCTITAPIPDYFLEFMHQNGFTLSEEEILERVFC